MTSRMKAFLGSSSVPAKERALEMLRNLPRVDKWALADNPGAKTKGRQVTSAHNKAGKGHKELQNAAKPPLGWILGDWYRPWQRRFPAEKHYNKDVHLRREYPPLSLLELQRLIDLGWIDTTAPIDLTTLCNTKLYKCKPAWQQFGVQLTDEGADVFAAKFVNLEVQWASELAISAIERNGGVIRTAYFDPVALEAAVDPSKFFERGEPVPKRAFPPVELLEYYTDANARGYLAEPSKIDDARVELAQKYGYQRPETSDEKVRELLRAEKHPRQVFYGLSPGSIVNMQDRTVLMPTDKDVVDYYCPSASG